MKNDQFYPELIEYWCDELGRYGLTLPFLIGAERIKTNLEDFEITDLLEELRDSNEKYFISDCGDLGEQVIGLHKQEYANAEFYKNYGSLYINSDELEKLNSFEEICDFLENKYSSNINSEEFSKNYYTGNWENFSQEDLHDIENAKK